MGTLYVYNEDDSDVDTVGAFVVLGSEGAGTNPTDFDTATVWASGVTRDDNTNAEVSENLTSLGTVPWKSRSVTVAASATKALSTVLADDAGFEVTVRGDDDACSGSTCSLPFNKTGGANAGTAAIDTIDVEVTAENGYDDHVYTVVVTVAAPVGNGLASANITVADSSGTTISVGDGDGTSTTGAWQYSTGDSFATAAFGLSTYGSVDDGNAYCAQSVEVKPLGGEKLKPMADQRNDICEGTRFKLPGSDDGTIYVTTITSEDGVKATYSLAVTTT